MFEVFSASGSLSALHEMLASLLNKKGKQVLGIESMNITDAGNGVFSMLAVLHMREMIEGDPKSASLFDTVKNSSSMSNCMSVEEEIRSDIPVKSAESLMTGDMLLSLGTTAKQPRKRIRLSD